ncbi:hypothetical protein BDF19DRAFT_445251 [Syncephalis fuscata]|nr:hypothetical protein BDF19DRAFT_445251 [Syncephalis fuscata]
MVKPPNLKYTTSATMPPLCSSSHPHHRRRFFSKLFCKWKIPFRMPNISFGPAVPSTMPEMSFNNEPQRTYSQSSTASRATAGHSNSMPPIAPVTPSPSLLSSSLLSPPSPASMPIRSSKSSKPSIFKFCLPCFCFKPFSTISRKIRSRRSSDHTLFSRYRRSKSMSTMMSAVRTPSLPTLKLLPSRLTLRAWRDRTSQSRTRAEMLDLLTPEIWRLVLYHLDPWTAIQLASTNRYYRSVIIYDQQVWLLLHDDVEKELLRWTIAHSDDSLSYPSMTTTLDIQEARHFLLEPSVAEPLHVTLTWPSNLSDEALATTRGNWYRRFARRARLEWRWRHDHSITRQLNLSESRSRQLRARPIAAGAWGTLLCLQDNEKGHGQLIFILVPTEPMLLPSIDSPAPLPSSLPDLLLLNGPPFSDLDHPTINSRFIATCGNILFNSSGCKQENVPTARLLIVWAIGKPRPVYQFKVDHHAQVVDLRDAWLLLRERSTLTSSWQYTLHHLDSGQRLSRSFTASFGCHIQRTNLNSAWVFCARQLDSTAIASTNSSTANVVSWTDKGHCVWQLLRFQLSDATNSNDTNCFISMRITGEGSSLTVVGSAMSTGRRRTIRHDDHHAALVEMGVSLDDVTALEVTLLDLRQSRVLRRERFTSTANMASNTNAATLGPDGNDALLDVTPWLLASPLRSPPMHHLFSRGVVDRRYRPQIVGDAAIQLHSRLFGQLHIHYEYPLARSSLPNEHVEAICIFDARTTIGSVMLANNAEEEKPTPSYGYYPNQTSDLPNHVLLRHLVTSPPEDALLQIIQFA